ncbi:MAG: GNAT family N-acetyltransferase [Myxococcales bacterium]|nr:GNAT family N-acetyltransferase [Myxococcales bacterium]
MNINIRSVQTKAERKQFVMIPWRIYKDDPKWVPPLIQDRMETLDPAKNPFFEHGEAQLFIAERDGEPVGRVTAHTNRLHNEYHKDKTGFFGFFESIDDPAVARALLEAAEGWLKQKGCDQALGPESFSTNEEVGMVVEDRAGSPMIMCSYNPPYYPRLLEACGYQKAKDLYGWYYTVGEVPEAPRQVADAVAQHPGLKLRTVDMKNVLRDVRIVRDIFNAAWSRNWGYVPWTEKEVEHSAEMLKLILIPEWTTIAEVDGQPAGMMIALPNINEVIKDLNGRLFPTGLLKLLWRVKLGGYRFKSGRLALLGVKPEYRGSVLGGLSVLLYVCAHRATLKYGLKDGELGWTLEDNQKINTGIQFMGGTIGKVYRVYGKSL